MAKIYTDESGQRWQLFFTYNNDAAACAASNANTNRIMKVESRTAKAVGMLPTRTVYGLLVLLNDGEILLNQQERDDLTRVTNAALDKAGL